MRILLLQDIKGLGRRGEVKNASNGYARNYLIPQKLAKAATDSESENIKRQTQAKSNGDIELKKILDDLKAKTNDSPVIVLIKVGKRGEIFRSIKTLDIEAALKLYDPLIPKNFEVEIKKPIKEMGQHEISLNLGRGIRNTFIIEVRPSI